VERRGRDVGLLVLERHFARYLLRVDSQPSWVEC